MQNNLKISLKSHKRSSKKLYKFNRVIFLNKVLYTALSYQLVNRQILVCLLILLVSTTYAQSQDSVALEKSSPQQQLEDIGAPSESFLDEEIYMVAEELLEVLKNREEYQGFLEPLQQTVQAYNRAGEYDKAEKLLSFLLRQQAVLDKGMALQNRLRLLYSQALSTQLKTEAALQILNSIEQPSVNDAQFLAEVNRTKGALLRDLGNYEESGQNYRKAIEQYKRVKNDSGIFKSYFGLAVLNIQLKDQKRANRYFKLAEKFITELQDSYQLADFYSNFGVNYRQLDSLDRAKDMMLEALAIAEKLDHTMLQAQNLLNIGNVYASQGKDHRAINYYERTLALSSQEEITYGQILAYISIGRRFYSLGNYNKSISYYDSSSVLISEKALPQESLTLYEYYADAYAKVGDSLLTQRYQRRYEKLQDSLLSAEAQNEILRKQSEFDISNQRAEIDQNMSTISRLSIYIWIALFISVLLLSLAVWLWRRNRRLKALFERNVQVQTLPPYLQPNIGASELTHDEKGSNFEPAYVSPSAKKDPGDPAEDEGETTLSHEVQEHLKQIFSTIIHLLEEEEFYRDKNLNIERLAQEVGTNKKYISDAIRYGSGGNFYDLIHKYRINQARQMLTNPAYKDYSLDVIYTKCGYKNASTFYKNFRDITGLTPAQYKKQNRVTSR